MSRRVGRQRAEGPAALWKLRHAVHPISLLRSSLLRFVDSKLPGSSLRRVSELVSNPLATACSCPSLLPTPSTPVILQLCIFPSCLRPSTTASSSARRSEGGPWREAVRAARCKAVLPRRRGREKGCASCSRVECCSTIRAWLPESLTPFDSAGPTLA